MADHSFDCLTAMDAPLTRRQFVPRFWLASLLVPTLARRPKAAELTGVPPTVRPDAAVELTEEVVERGLNYLASHQNDDGSFQSGRYARNVAVCGLAGMAFLASGSTPGRGPYGLHVQRSVDYILDHTQDSGFVIAPDAQSHGPMYGHGFATLFLAEVYGMSRQPQLREKLSKAVGLIVLAQNDQGGWRYFPQRRDADLSVTVCQMMALRAARNAGLFVPRDTVQRCVEYVKRCQEPDGGFRYQLDRPGSAFPRSAAGVVGLQSAGIYEGEEIRRGLAYLRQFRPSPNALRLGNYFFYGHYYAVQAMWQAGKDWWQSWFPGILDVLVRSQEPAGYWADLICPEYGTAMALLILQVPNGYLPIFQR